MIGIIIWLLLILFIVICAVPCFGQILLALLGLSTATILALWIYVKLTDHPSEQRATIDREKAIDEWERKWKRKHPSRINR